MSGALREIVGLLGFDVDERSIVRVDNQLDRYQRRVAEVTAAQQRMSLGLWAGIAAGLAANAWYQANSEAQTLAASLDLVTGSAEGTAQAMAFVQEFAQLSPDSLAQVTAAYQMLRAQGLDPTTERMTALGDSAAAVQTDVQTLIDAISGGTIGNTERLDVLFARFGLNFSSRQGVLSAMIDGEMREIGSSFEEISAFVEELGQGRFAGGMERMAATMSGQMGMLGDSVYQFLVSVGDAGLRDAVTGLVQSTTALLDTNGDLSTVIGRALSRAVRLAAMGMQWLADNQDKVQQGLSWIGTWVAGSTLVRMVHLLRQVSLSMGLIALEALAVQLAVGAAFIGAAFIIDDFMGWLAGKDSVIGTFVDANGEADGAMGDLARFFLDLRDHGKDALDLMWADIQSIWAGIRQLASMAYDHFAAPVVDAIDVIREALRTMVPEEIRPYLDWLMSNTVGNTIGRHPLAMIGRMVTGDFSDSTDAGNRLAGGMMGGASASRQLTGADGAPITSAGTERTWWQWMRGVDAESGGGASMAQAMMPANQNTQRNVTIDVQPAEVLLQLTVDSPDVADQVARRLQRELPSLMAAALEPAFERARLEE